jgi:hypothetical protein
MRDSNSEPSQMSKWDLQQCDQRLFLLASRFFRLAKSLWNQGISRTWSFVTVKWKTGSNGQSWLPFKVKHSCAVLQFQILKVPSIEDETQLEPSRATAMSMTPSEWPRDLSCGFKYALVFRSHTLKVLSCDPDNAFDPSAMIVTNLKCNKLIVNFQYSFYC